MVDGTAGGLVTVLMVAPLFSKEGNLGHPSDPFGRQVQVLSFRKVWRSWFRARVISICVVSEAKTWVRPLRKWVRSEQRGTLHARGR